MESSVTPSFDPGASVFRCRFLLCPSGGSREMLADLERRYACTESAKDDVVEPGRGIVVDACRVNEGGGVFPIYAGRRIAEAVRESVASGATEFAAARVGGSEVAPNGIEWAAANLSAWMRACREPAGDPWVWAREFAVEAFGRGGAIELANALVMSEELAARLFVVPGIDGGAIVDGCALAEGPPAEAYDAAHVDGRVTLLMDGIDATDRLADKTLAFACAASELMANPRQADAVRRSYAHLFALAPVLTNYQRAILWARHRAWPHLTPIGAAEVRSWLARDARAAIAAYRMYRARHDLYRDGGMLRVLRATLRELNEPLPPEIEPAIPRTVSP